jgi:parvulin-like peptidyl-prolyl isomerase
MKLYFHKYMGLVLILILIPSCTGEQEEQEIIAKVNDRQITLQEFRTFYELDPNFAIDSTGPGALLDELNKYIDQILAYNRAEETDLPRDSSYIKGHNWEMRQAMLRELYRQQVQQQINVDDQELRAEFLKGMIQVHVRQLFSKGIEQAVQWYTQLSTGVSFQILAREAFRDSLLAANGGDLGWVQLNSLDDDFGNAILNLRQNEISKPVHTRWGYHIIQLLDRRDQVIIPETEFQRQRPLVEKKIRQRKGRQLAGQFIKDFMGKYNPQPDPGMFRFLWQQLVPLSQQENKILPMAVELNDELIHHIEQNYRNYLEKPLINFTGGSFSLGDYFAGVQQMPYGNRPRVTSAEQLSNQLGNWVRDELLSREAKRRNLDREPRVQADVRSIMEQQFYNLLVEQEIGALPVPDSVSAYFNLPAKERGRKNQAGSRFNNPEEWRWAEAEKNVHNQLRRGKIQVWIDRNKLRRESRGINWDRRIRMFMVRQ